MKIRNIILLAILFTILSFPQSNNSIVLKFDKKNIILGTTLSDFKKLFPEISLVNSNNNDGIYKLTTDNYNLKLYFNSDDSNVNNLIALEATCYSEECYFGESSYDVIAKQLKNDDRLLHQVNDGKGTNTKYYHYPGYLVIDEQYIGLETGDPAFTVSLVDLRYLDKWPYNIDDSALYALSTRIENLAIHFNGTWKGKYKCNQVETGLTLKFSASPDGKLTAIFNFYPLSSSNLLVKSGSFALEGEFFDDNTFTLEAKKWINKPSYYEMVDIKGKIESNYVEINGVIVHPNCSTFNLIKQNSKVQTSENVENQNEGFEIFWQKFSKAVINKQKDKVISFTYFPFYSDYGFLDQQKFSNNYDWLFDENMIKGIKNAKIDQLVSIGENESVELIRLNTEDSNKILKFLKLSVGRVIYYFKYHWVEETSDKYLELWNDLVFIQFENTFKLVSDQNPWISF
ncbi:MAG: hypothetical protein DAHOPDDO_02907 [Ignavibacteriaceae bacterium]|nr:hypothetical protein [Ignavibacteriaceae bacterium]